MNKLISLSTLLLLSLNTPASFADTDAVSGGSTAVSNSQKVATAAFNSWAYFYYEGNDHVVACNKFDCKKVKVDDK